MRGINHLNLTLDIRYALCSMPLIELTSFSSLNEMIFSMIIDFDEERRGAGNLVQCISAPSHFQNNAVAGAMH